MIIFSINGAVDDHRGEAADTPMTVWIRSIRPGRDVKRDREPKRTPGPAHRPWRYERPWWDVMGFQDGPPRSLRSVETRFRQLVAAAHPDRGGDPERMHQLVQARAAARRALST